jgi:hypothetical protein
VARELSVLLASNFLFAYDCRGKPLSQGKKTFVFRYYALLRDWSLFHRCLENAADTSDTNVDGCGIELNWLLTHLSNFF